MKLKYVYPGSFCPPTYGHWQTVKKAAKLFDRLTIVCSDNPHKANKWFMPEQCADLWRHGYQLPDNVTVTTIDEIKSAGVDFTSLVIVRGVRNETHFEEEKGVLFLNHSKLGIDKFFYLVSDNNYSHISSSKVRNFVSKLELEKLSDYVSPLVISALLERTLKIRDIHMVVGRPGSGKTTFFKRLHQLYSDDIHINTDEFMDELKPLLKQKFGDRDLIELALTDEELLKSVIAKPWLELLKQRLDSVPRGSRVYVEIPYGLQSDKNMFRFVGGKVIYYQVGNGANEREICIKRAIERGTPELVPFIDRIPDLLASRKIASQHKLELSWICASEDMNRLEYQVAVFNQTMKQGG